MRRNHRARKRHRGAVLVEYALLLTFFAVPVCAAMVAGGIQVLNGYKTTRSAVLQPWP
jgi:Flp pilus assembly pilin Flp